MGTPISPPPLHKTQSRWGASLLPTPPLLHARNQPTQQAHSSNAACATPPSPTSVRKASISTHRERNTHNKTRLSVGETLSHSLTQPTSTVTRGRRRKPSADVSTRHTQDATTASLRAAPPHTYNVITRDVRDSIRREDVDRGG